MNEASPAQELAPPELAAVLGRIAGLAVEGLRTPAAGAPLCIQEYIPLPIF
jgi:hypothetical protein